MNTTYCLTPDTTYCLASQQASMSLTFETWTIQECDPWCICENCEICDYFAKNLEFVSKDNTRPIFHIKYKLRGDHKFTTIAVRGDDAMSVQNSILFVNKALDDRYSFMVYCFDIGDWREL